MFNGIKTITTPQGNKYELHWNGSVQTYDTYDAAARVLVDKMAVDAGRTLTSTKESAQAG